MTVTFTQAINQAFRDAMTSDPSVFIYGIGAPDHKRIFGTLNGLVEEFPGRVLDTPLSEEAMLGFGFGAAINGLRPVHTHIRVDFLLLAMNQLVNLISSHYGPVPLVVRAIVGRGWGQGCQHSKSLHAMFAHIPGLHVYAPVTPYDAYFGLRRALEGVYPTVFLEHRWLHWAEGPIDEKGDERDLATEVMRGGGDITIAATSWMVVEALQAADVLAKNGISAEVIAIKQLTAPHIGEVVDSVQKTGRLLVADNDWWFCGYSAEIITAVVQECQERGWPVPLVKRFGWQHRPCPTARHLENQFYHDAGDLAHVAAVMCGRGVIDLSGEDFYSHERKFKGPF